MTLTQTEADALNTEYEAYIRPLRAEWLAQNRPVSKEVYEVRRPEEQAEVHRCIDRCKQYITPLAEVWWRKRGCGVIWPDDDSKPMQFFRLEEAEMAIELKAPPSKIRVVGVDLFDDGNYLVDDYDSEEEAFEVADDHNRSRQGEMVDVYYVYNDQGEYLRGNEDVGQEVSP